MTGFVRHLFVIAVKMVGDLALSMPLASVFLLDENNEVSLSLTIDSPAYELLSRCSYVQALYKGFSD